MNFRIIIILEISWLACYRLESKVFTASIEWVSNYNLFVFVSFDTEDY
jgi:hypothetical protein